MFKRIAINYSNEDFYIFKEKDSYGLTLCQYKLINGIYRSEPRAEEFFQISPGKHLHFKLLKELFYNLKSFYEHYNLEMPEMKLRHLYLYDNFILVEKDLFEIMGKSDYTQWMAYLDNDIIRNLIKAGKINAENINYIEKLLENQITYAPFNSYLITYGSGNSRLEAIGDLKIEFKKLLDRDSYNTIFNSNLKYDYFNSSLNSDYLI